MPELEADPKAKRRDQQLASQIRHAVQTIIDRGLHDPRIAGMITVTGVRVLDEGRLAHVSVSVLPGEKQGLTLKGLIAAAGHIRQEIGGAIHGRMLPRLEFRLDESAKKQAGVLGAIAQIEHERERGEDRPGFHAPKQAMKKEGGQGGSEGRAS